MGDVGKPERIVEDEPIGFPDEEPLTAPAPVPAPPATAPPVPAEPEKEPAPTGLAGQDGRVPLPR
ncbi:hypothetical protein BBK14_18495 [Parafrankia soli]|uniref:Uncharacterized protein n=1 Tax=Parafrankia soli TaxID=2599596 RepID=A0A1S1Q2Y0_9ACTN|nr:hypothetical protein [Parafrankia soli]OHV27956.1 hypothetical protein BBK14_18495 [Parafrankia soli]